MVQQCGLTANLVKIIVLTVLPVDLRSTSGQAVSCANVITTVNSPNPAISVII